MSVALLGASLAGTGVVRRFRRSASGKGRRKLYRMRVIGGKRSPPADLRY